MRKVFLLLLILCISCNKKEKEKDIQIIDLKTNGVISFESIFTKKSSFVLEENAYSQIGYVRNVIPINNQYLFIVDSNINEAIKIFDITGKYKGNLGKVGEGPGEYKFPISIQGNESQIYLYDGQLRRITIYNSKDFSYQKSFNVKYFYTAILLYKNKLILKRQNWSENSINIGEFDIYDLSGEIIDNIVLNNEFDQKKTDIKKIPEFNFGCILFQKEKLIYIDMIEYKLLCYDLNYRKLVWQKQLDIRITNNLKNESVNKKSNKYVIYALHNINDKSILLEMGPVYYMFDKYGNNKQTIKLPNKFISKFSKTNLFTSSQPLENQQDKIENPRITIYSIL